MHDSNTHPQSIWSSGKCSLKCARLDFFCKHDPSALDPVHSLETDAASGSNSFLLFISNWWIQFRWLNCGIALHDDSTNKRKRTYTNVRIPYEHFSRKLIHRNATITIQIYSHLILIRIWVQLILLLFLISNLREFTSSVLCEHNCLTIIIATYVREYRLKQPSLSFEHTHTIHHKHSKLQPICRTIQRRIIAQYTTIRLQLPCQQFTFNLTPLSHIRLQTRKQLRHIISARRRPLKCRVSVQYACQHKIDIRKRRTDRMSSWANKCGRKFPAAITSTPLNTQALTIPWRSVRQVCVCVLYIMFGVALDDELMIAWRLS